MKSIEKIFLSLTAALLVGTAGVQAQQTNDPQRAELEKLSTSTSEADKSALNGKLKALAASASEGEVDLAIQYYYKTKQEKAADSLINVSLSKFPKGWRASEAWASKGIYDKKKTLADREKAYLQWVKMFPLKPGNEIFSDYIVSSLANEYALAGNAKKAEAYAALLKEDFWKGNGYGSLAERFAKAGDTARAKLYTKKAIDVTAPFFEGKRGSDGKAKFSAIGYPGFLSSYADILMREKNYPEALKYAKMSVDLSKEPNLAASYRYAKILSAMGRNEEAFQTLETLIRAGKANQAVSNSFKELYTKTKGSEEGYDQYAGEIKAAMLASLQQRLNREMISTPAANFNLTDLKGNTVSLADLKGKTVILDFWATWCGPCKASFPAMQLAVNKYKNDPSVKFLFIHTWEREEGATKEAADFIAQNKYTFDVLMDLKDPKTRANKVVTDYKVSGIPTKFVIDPQGQIRFRLMGFEGSDDMAVNELSMMIDMARKPAAAKSR